MRPLCWAHWATPCDRERLPHLRHEIISLANGEQLAIVEEGVLQGNRPPESPCYVQLLLLGAPHPVREFHHVGHGGGEKHEVHVIR